MRAHRPSLTAQAVAISRASHQLLDAPRVLDDPLALPILGPTVAAAVRRGVRVLDVPGARALRAYVVARSRLAEDRLAQAVARGVRQYVLLGAGLDTVAYRHSHRAAGLRVFEVDHPATQAWKRRRLAAGGIAVPGEQALRHVALDFETQSLEAVLPAHGFDAQAPAVFAWLGVSMYLGAEDLAATLRAIGALSAPGSALVFDYLTPAGDQAPLRRALLGGLALGVRALGERWKGRFTPAQIQALLAQGGLAPVQDAAMADIEARYFANRLPRLPLGPLVRMVTAEPLHGTTHTPQKP